MGEQSADVPVPEPSEYDPYWDNVVLLLKGDGTDGSVDVVDHSKYAHTISANGSAQIRTDQSMFGGSSMYFNGTTGSSFTTNDSEHLSYGVEDLTIELFFRHEAQAQSYPRLLSNNIGYSASKNDNFHITAYMPGVSSDNLRFGGSRIGNPTIAVKPSLVVGHWYHVAITRASGAFYLYFDGVLSDQSSSYLTSSLAPTTKRIEVGGETGHSTTYFKGHIDELRITKGVARYTENFTPPTEPFPTQGSTAQMLTANGLEFNDTNGPVYVQRFA
jgi:hypothetical protein